MVSVRSELVVVVMLAVTMTTRGQWTDCTQVCGTGSRTNANMEFTISCHNFGCSYEASCPCGETDLIFVMDESGSIGENNFWIQKQFAVDVVDGSRYSDAPASATTRVGFIKFSTGMITVFDLNDGYSAADQATSDAIWDTPYNKGTTETWLGLDAARDMLIAQGLSTNKWVVVVITDGESNDISLTSTAAAQLQATGASVYAIGIGQTVNVDELKNIASDPDDSFMYHVADFEGLGAIIEDVLNGTCCDSYEVCEVVSQSTQCTVSCGGGVTYVYELCSSYNSHTGQLLRQEWSNTTSSCCTQSCPLDQPTVEDCADCDYQAGIGYLQDPNDCRCYYMCQDFGQNNYVIYDQQCCQDPLYWEQEIYSCGWLVPTTGCILQNGSNVCGDFTNPPKPSTTACPYHQNPNNPNEYLNADGSHAGNCDTAWIYDNWACSCVYVPPINCDSDPLLHYPFDDHLNDVTCTGAWSDTYPQGSVPLVAGGRVDKAAQFHGASFITVPYMSGHFSYTSITRWSVTAWYKRTSDFHIRAGLVENGDCDDEPSFALSINAQEFFVATLKTTTAQQTNSMAVQNMRNIWVHVAMTYDGSYLRVYVNGAKSGTDVSISGPIADNNHCNMKMGHRYDPADTEEGFFIGLMDEVYVYERTLSNTEILNLYSSPGTSRQPTRTRGHSNNGPR